MNDEQNNIQNEIKRLEEEKKLIQEKKKKISGSIKVTKVIKEGVLFSLAVIFTFVMITAILLTLNGVDEVYRAGGDDEIAVLHVSGTIASGVSDTYNHSMFLEQLEATFKDEKVKAVIIQMDTPGGGVIESEQIYEKINSLKEEYNKPYVSYMNSMAASGGYYISANADKIVANKHTITGSIGVIMSSLNMGELFDEYGIKMEVIKSGKHKDIMSSYREMTSEEREILQSLIDEMYGYFVDIIVDGRGMPRKEVIEIADGRVYSAKQAKELNLIDEIGTLDDAITIAEELAGIKDTTVRKYYQTIPIFARMSMLLQRNKLDSLELNLLNELNSKKGFRYELIGLTN